MTLKPGMDFIGDSSTVTYEAGETVSPGDVVGISDGQLGAGSAGLNALTDEGAVAGLSSNEAVPDGYAVVDV